MTKALEKRNARLATKFSYLNLNSAPKPLNFRECDNVGGFNECDNVGGRGNESTSNHARQMLDWLREHNHVLSVPDFIDLLAYHNNVAYETLHDKGGWIGFFWLNDDFDAYDARDGYEVDPKYQDVSSGGFYNAVQDCFAPELKTETDYFNDLVLLMSVPTQSAVEPNKITAWTNTDNFRDFSKREAIDVLDWFKSNFRARSKQAYEEMLESFNEDVETMADGAWPWW